MMQAGLRPCRSLLISTAVLAPALLAVTVGAAACGSSDSADGGTTSGNDPVCKALEGCTPGVLPGASQCPTTTGTIAPSLRMSFFVTSVGNGSRGGNYGGLSGADARCQCLGRSVGLGSKNWRAYLSTLAENARDRIGTGPWFNYFGREIGASVDQIHANGIDANLMFTELGALPPSSEHDILTGSEPNGRALPSLPSNPAAPPPNCANWSSAVQGAAFVGHVDWNLPGSGGSWNSQHDTQGCSEAVFKTSAGTGRLYCFAIP